MDRTPSLHRRPVGPAPVALSAVAALLFLAACADPAEETPDGADAAADGGAPIAAPCAPLPAPAGDGTCPVTLRWKADGRTRSIAVAGEWNDFSTTALTFGPPEGGEQVVSFRLRPGLYAYKLVLNGGEWILDPRNPYRKYHGGVENSGLRVLDCSRPRLVVAPGSLKISRPANGQGELVVQLRALDGNGQPAPLCTLSGTLRRPETHLPTGTPPPRLPDAALRLDQDTGAAELRLRDLVDGKYTVALTPSAHGIDGEPLLLPFWIEPAPFSWADTPLYMAMTDRFSDGDGKNPGRLAGVSTAANFQGGDLAGLTEKIERGYFERLGIRALWLTPFYTQPATAHIDQTGAHDVAAYHGYWPVKARQVDPRIGGDEALHTLVETAHRHGMRVMMDAVLNHVHEQHEYFQDPAKKAWFRTGCTCGTAGCDWTEKRLSCLFARYMPDIDWTVTAASEQFITDTLWWLQEFDLDGLRIDAVKHVEDLAIFNLGSRVRERFEQAGTRYYLLGETAMGWSEGTPAQNRENYDTIKRYMGGAGDAGLDGQFDFVWYHAIPYRVFAYDEKRFLHLDYWTHASLSEFKGGLMVNYLGSHDTSRFISMAMYRDTAAGSMWNRGIANNKWENLPLPPQDQEPYDRLWLGMLSVMTVPGVPLLYYGDEYGEFGGGDPDNRHGMRFDTQLAPREKTQLLRMTRLLAARRDLAGLRRGPLVTALLGEDVYGYARPDADPKKGALVILNRTTTSRTAMVPLPSELGWATGTKLRDRLGATPPGPGDLYTVGGSVLAVTVPARGGVILAAE
jgi:glycosidase